MGLKIMRASGGGYRPMWYAQIKNLDGAYTTENLNVPIHGTPPKSLKLKDTGDEAFERSRVKAQAAFQALLEERKDKRGAVRLIEKSIEIKTNGQFSEIPINELATRYRQRHPREFRSEAHSLFIDGVFARFAKFATARNCRFLLRVTPEMAGDFYKELKAEYSSSTTHKYIYRLSGAFKSLVPPEFPNPFIGICEDSKGHDEGGTIHRRPLSEDELFKLFATARDGAYANPMLYKIIVTETATGLRCGDACNLRWSSVDLKDGFIDVEKTSKTSAPVTIPLFDCDPKGENYEPLYGEFRRILEIADTKRKNRKNPNDFVFPDVAATYNANPNHIYATAKVLFARALFGDEANVTDAVIEGEEPTPDEIRAAIMATDKAPIRPNRQSAFHWTDAHKQRVLDTYNRYSTGETYSQIQRNTGRSRSQISIDLADVERITGAHIRPNADGKATIRDLLKKTRSEQTNRKRGASIYGLHSLRASFVVMAITKAGMELADVQKIVGHSTVNQTLEYYNPTRKIAATKLKMRMRQRKNAHAEAERVLEGLSREQILALQIALAPKIAAIGEMAKT